MEVRFPFLLRFTLYLRAIFQVQASGGLYLEGRFKGGFFALPAWGVYIWRGLFSEVNGMPSLVHPYFEFDIEQDEIHKALLMN